MALWLDYSALHCAVDRLTTQITGRHRLTIENGSLQSSLRSSPPQADTEDQTADHEIVRSSRLG
jgi:hypothetical protein